MMRANKTRIFLPIKKVVHDMDWLLCSLDGQSLLEKARLQQKIQRLRCQCKAVTAAQPELVVRLRHGRYYIARMPGTCHLHERATCELFSENAEHSGIGEYVGAIEYDGDVAEIKVNFSLKKAIPAMHPVPGGRPDSKSGRVKRGSMGLSVLLSYLWSAAGLNAWTPGTVRPWSWVYSSVKDAAGAIRLGERALADLLHVQPDSKQVWLPTAPADPTDGQDYSLLLFKVNGVAATPFGGAYLKTSVGAAILAKETVLKAIERSYPRAWRLLEQPWQLEDGVKPPKLICLALVQWDTIKGAPGLSIVQAALMMTNWRDIPVESRYELRVADQLVEQSRFFTKPMRFDAAEDVVFADFLLSDVVDDAVPMEVYGISGNAKYEQRKGEKRDHYRKSGQVYWEWTPEEAIPAFPPKRRS